jgi:hypothetical protein
MERSMTVRELIAALQRCPPEMDVCVWDHEQDDWMPVVEALNEWGSTHIALLIHPSGVLLVHVYGSCGGVCDLCGDQ